MDFIEELPNMIKEKQKEAKVKKIFESIAVAVSEGIKNGRTQAAIPFRKEDLQDFIDSLEEQHILVFVDPASERVTIDWGLVS